MLNHRTPYMCISSYWCNSSQVLMHRSFFSNSTCGVQLHKETNSDSQIGRSHMFIWRTLMFKKKTPGKDKKNHSILRYLFEPFFGIFLEKRGLVDIGSDLLIYTNRIE